MTATELQRGPQKPDQFRSKMIRPLGNVPANGHLRRQGKLPASHVRRVHDTNRAHASYKELTCFIIRSKRKFCLPMLC